MHVFAQVPILVPVDFSERCFAAVEVAVEIAEDASPVHALHVLHEPQTGHPDPIWVSIEHAKRKQHAASALEGELQDRQHSDVATHVEFGDAGLRIAEFAKHHNVGLIVMPSHGRTGLERLLLGSITERVLRTAHCPVLVLRE